MATKLQQLYVFLNDTPMGMLSRGLGGKLSFNYEDDYLNSRRAIPFSLSIPLDDRSIATKSCILDYGDSCQTMN